MRVKCAGLSGLFMRTGVTPRSSCMRRAARSSLVQAMMGMQKLFWLRYRAPPPCWLHTTMNFAPRSCATVHTPCARAAVR